MLSELPDVFRKLPDGLGELPDVFSEPPDLFTQRPDVAGERPDVFSELPDEVGELPSVIGELSGVFREAAEGVCELTDLFSGASSVLTLAVLRRDLHVSRVRAGARELFHKVGYDYPVVISPSVVSQQSHVESPATDDWLTTADCRLPTAD